MISLNIIHSNTIYFPANFAISFLLGLNSIRYVCIYVYMYCVAYMLYVSIYDVYIVRVYVCHI